jgi:two-component system, cell cycle response regulator
MPKRRVGIWKENHGVDSIEGVQHSGQSDVARRMLIASDDRVTLRQMGSQLSKCGYDLIVCGNGGEAWKILQREDTPRLAILDRVLPDMSGPQICRQLRTIDRQPYVYVILLSSRKEDIEEVLEAGANDFIAKPFDSNELKVRIRAAELQDQLRTGLASAEFRACRDNLTGLFNRGGIFEILAKELIRSSRTGSNLGVIIGDLDQFKEINDQYGHLAGDDVLKSVANAILGMVRPYDAVGRYAGDEFLIVLPECGQEMALKAAERIRRVVDETPIVTREGPVRVTMSFGVAAAQGLTTSSTDHVFKLADESLYRAKRKGRNWVDLFEKFTKPKLRRNRVVLNEPGAVK